VSSRRKKEEEKSLKRILEEFGSILEELKNNNKAKQSRKRSKQKARKKTNSLNENILSSGTIVGTKAPRFGTKFKLRSRNIRAQNGESLF